MAYESVCGAPFSTLARISLHALVALAMAVSSSASVRPDDPARLCQIAAHRAAAATGVPFSVLMAISLTETGRSRGGRMRPWPWTVNMEGKGLWFDSADKARAYAEKHFTRGARSFDVGCFQLNYKWHGQNFASIGEMFRPLPNALYAARFLARLYREKGDWSAAAGAYHSRNRKFASRYRERFDRILAARSGYGSRKRLVAADAVGTRELKQTATPRVNSYPLLKAGQGGRGMGSLVPVTARDGPRLFSSRKPGAEG